jgi:hypothetical protein
MTPPRDDSELRSLQATVLHDREVLLRGQEDLTKRTRDVEQREANNAKQLAALEAREKELREAYAQEGLRLLRWLVRMLPEGPAPAAAGSPVPRAPTAPGITNSVALELGKDAKDNVQVLKLVGEKLALDDSKLGLVRPLGPSLEFDDYRDDHGSLHVLERQKEDGHKKDAQKEIAVFTVAGSTLRFHWAEPKEQPVRQRHFRDSCLLQVTRPGPMSSRGTTHYFALRAITVLKAMVLQASGDGVYSGKLELKDGWYGPALFLETAAVTGQPLTKTPKGDSVFLESADYRVVLRHQRQQGDDVWLDLYPKEKQRKPSLTVTYLVVYTRIDDKRVEVLRVEGTAQE